jgi:hypothetical protein
MKHRHVLAFAAASMMSLGAIAQLPVTVEVAPPPPVAEAVPAPRAGFTWSGLRMGPAPLGAAHRRHVDAGRRRVAAAR